MAYKGLVTELPMGRAGMVNHENRLLSDPTQLYDAEGTTYEDDHVQRQRGASAYDTAGLAQVIQFTGDYDVSATWDAYLFTFVPGSGTPSWTRTVGTAATVTTASGIWLTVTVATSAIPVGAKLVVVSATSNFKTGETCTVVDSQGNTWTNYVSPSVDNKGNWDSVCISICDVTTQIEIGNTITAAWAGCIADPLGASFVMTCDQFANCGAVDIQLDPTINPSTGHDVSGTAVTTRVSTSPLATLPELLFGTAIAYDGNVITFTPSGGFTKRADVNTTTSPTDLKITTATRVDSAQPVIVGMSDWASYAVTTPAGTVTTTAGSRTVTGSGTTFTDHAPGDEIGVAGEVQVIESIASATSLTTVGYWRNSNAGVAYKRRVGRRLITVTSEGSVFKEKPSTLTTGNLDATTVSSALSKTSGPTFFVPGGKEAAANNRKLFIYTGVDPVKVLSGDGTSIATIATLPAGSDWSSSADPWSQPIAGTVHQSRHVGWGNWTDPHRLYFSDPDNHENFNNAGVTFTVRVRSDIGERLYCGISFNGILFSWKFPRGIFWLDDSDLDPTNWQIRDKSTAIGCAPSPYAALAMDDDVIFMAANGSFHLLSAVDALGGTKASDLTHALGLDKWMRENVNLSRLDRIVSVWDQHRKTAIFFVPSVGSTANDLVLRFDFGLVATGGPVRFGWDARDAATAATIRQPLGASGPETPIIGDQTFCYLLDQDTFQKNGANYGTTIQTPHVDCSWIHPSFRYLKKQYDALELIFEPSGCAGTCTAEVYVDNVLKQTLTYDVTQRRQKLHLTAGDGHTISVKVTKGDENNMKLLSMILFFHATNEDQSR